MFEAISFDFLGENLYLWFQNVSFIMKSTKMKWFMCLGFILLQYKWYHVVFNVIVHKYGKRLSRSNELNLALVLMQLQDNAQQKKIWKFETVISIFIIFLNPKAT